MHKHARAFRLLLILTTFYLLASPLAAQDSIGGGIYSSAARRAYSVYYAQLGSPLNGSFYYCVDCTTATPPLSGGTGSFVVRINGAWTSAGGGGGGSTPGGASGTLQYNNAGVLGGVTSSSVSGANVALGGTLTIPTGPLKILNPAGDGLGFSTTHHGPVYFNSLTAFSYGVDSSGLTGNRTYTAPDATGTFALTSSNVATATALAANGTNCSAGNYPLGVDAQGNSENCTAVPSAGANTALSNLASVAINAPLATGVGTTLALSSTAPAQQSATVAGTPITITSSGPTQGSSTTARQPGGSITITAADCAGTSGNCNGAGILLNPGLQGSAGTVGAVYVKPGSLLRLDDGSAPTAPYGLTLGPTVVNGAVVGGANRVSILASGSEKGAWTAHGLGIGTTFCLQSGTDLDDNNRDTNLCRDAAGVWKVVGGGTGGDAKGALKVIADSNGSYTLKSSATELLTLSTSGTTTTTAGNLAVTQADINEVLARVTTTITTATDWSLSVSSGISSCTTAWVASGTTTSAQTGLTAGTIVRFVPAAGLRCTTAGATTLTITTTGTPGAGAIRLTVPYSQGSPPAN